VLGLVTTGRGDANEPGGRYLVVRRPLAPGDRIATDDVEIIEADLPPSVARRVFADAAVVDGATVLAPFAPGELLQAGAVAPSRTDATDVPDHEFSFRVGTARAVAGDLRAGERVDLLATYGAEAGGYTTLIAPSALVLGVAQHAPELAEPDTLVVTVGLEDRGAVLAVAHAAATNALTVVRSTATPAGEPAPDTYRPPAP
jgi:Flp pilus assembly protein CpaB